MEAYIEVLPGDPYTILFTGCNYRCRYCNAPQLIEQVKDSLKELRDITRELDKAHPSIVLFTGGEPLLQRQPLLKLLNHCKKSGYKTILETNGSKPMIIEQLLREELVNEIVIDLKGPRDLFKRVTRAETFFKPSEEFFSDILNTLKIVKRYRGRVLVSLRTVVTPGLLYKKEDLLELTAMLDGFRGTWTLRPFLPDVTLDPSLKGVESPTTRFLETLAGFVRKENPNLRVEIEDILSTNT